MVAPEPLFAEMVTLVQTSVNGTNSNPEQIISLGTDDYLQVVSAQSSGGGVSFIFQPAGTNQVNWFAEVVTNRLPSFTFFAGPGTFRMGRIGYQAVATVNVVRSTPTTQLASTVVIPDDGGGPVQIILESSTDLITWTAANPGTYGTTSQKRFFRLRAVRQ
jgi:hypothetical protein